jgi:hypothetical protein
MSNWVSSHLERYPQYAAMPIVKRVKKGLHLRQQDGSVVAFFTSAPCHYLDPIDGWVPLDTTLLPVSGKHGARGRSERVQLDGTIESGVGYSQRTTGLVVFNTKTAKVKNVHTTIPSGHIDGDRLVRNTSAGQHVLRLHEAGFRETFSLTAFSGWSVAAHEWLMLETLVTGITLPDGWLSGPLHFAGLAFPTPMAQDASGVTVAMRQYAKKQGNRQYIYTGIPVAWLAVAVYPVVLDPDFTSAYEDNACFSSSGSSWSNARDNMMGGTMYPFSTPLDPTMTVGCGYGYDMFSKNYIYYVSRGYFLFDTSSIGQEAVQTCNLVVTPSSKSYIYQDVDFYVVKQDSRVIIENVDGWGTIYHETTHSPKDNTWGNTANMIVDQPMTSAALDPQWVVTDGITTYTIVGSWDYNNTPPSEDQRLGIYRNSSMDPAKQPYLVVTYGGGAGVSFVPVLLNQYRRRV